VPSLVRREFKYRGTSTCSPSFKPYLRRLQVLLICTEIMTEQPTQSPTQSCNDSATMGPLNNETTFSMASTRHLRDRRESILSVREVCERLSDAEASYYLSPEEPARKAMLTMCWDQSDTTGSTDSDAIVSLVSEVFGFKTEQFKIPTEQSLNRTKAKILESRLRYP
jgi:hypothetical protein